MKRTSLYDLYKKYGAKMVDFHGWEMPVQFSKIQDEHLAVRTHAGLFDVSHMGEFVVTGENADAQLQRLTTNDLSKLKEGSAQYTVMCYEDGGTVDDLIVYKIAKNHYMLVINASNIESDLKWIRSHASGDVQIENRSDQIALLALQGPKAESILQSLTNTDLDSISFFQFRTDVNIQGVKALVSRTGYTGENGFEMYCGTRDAPALWEKITKAPEAKNLLPCGLGARDTLRLEAGLMLYGQDLSPDITPIEAGIGFAVKVDQPDFFLGKSVLKKQKEDGPARKLIGLEMIEKGIPRMDYPVFSGEKKIGKVTSGTQSPLTKKNIGLALLRQEYTDVGTIVEVGIRKKRLKACVVKKPFL